MIRQPRQLLALLTILAAPALAAANETPESSPPKFYVYGGVCSRSVHLQGAYESLDDACEAAQALRTKQELRLVTVRTGMHKKDYFGDAATEYKVYRRGVRCGNWILQATVKTADEARKSAESLRTERTPVEIVGHYATE